MYRLGYDAWGDGNGLDAYLATCRASRKYAEGVWWIHAAADGAPASALLSHDIPLPSGSPAVGLGSIATAPEFRGRGFASRLIEDVIVRHERDAGTEVFFLFSDIAPAFYERFRFSTVMPCPRKPESLLMARAEPKKLAGLLAHPEFQIPDYF